MGLFNQLIRSIRNSVKRIFQRKKKGRKLRRDEPDVVPRKWSKKDEKSPGSQKLFVVKHKKRIPGLLWFKRILAGFLLLVNFVLSQFLLGSIGEGAQPMFILFLLNCFILLDYLWKTRRKPE